MEDFPTDIMLFFALILMLFLETGRMFLFRRFKLHLPRQAPWQETYYVRYAFLCFALTPFFTALVGGLNLVWRVARQDPYAAGLFLLFLAGLIAGLLFVALRRIMPLSRLMPLLVIGTVLDILLFIYKGTRLFFGGTLMALVTSAVGQPMRFTDWTGMLEWLKGCQGGEEAHVRFLVQAEAVVRREPGGQTSIRTVGVSEPQSPSERQQNGAVRHLTLQLAGFIQQHWAEWEKSRKAGKPQGEINRNLYLGIQHEFFPGWLAMLDELARMLVLLPAQITQEGIAAEDQDRRKMRIQGILEAQLVPILLDAVEMNIPSAHATYLRGIARWLGQRVIDLVLHDWKKLVAWAQDSDKARAQGEIARWLSRDLLPGTQPGLLDLASLAHKVLTRLEADALNDPTLDQVEKQIAGILSEQLPLRWLGFMEAMSEQVAAYRQPYQADSWTEQLLDNARLEMISQAVLQMGEREDLLRKSARVVSANLAWFSDLSRQMNHQWEWHQKVRDARVKEIAELEKSAAPPRPAEVESKIAETARAIAEAEEELARIKPGARGAVEKLLSTQLLPRWQHDLQGLSQAILQVLPELAGEQPPPLQPVERQPSARRGSGRRKKPELLPPEERQLFIRPLLERELPSGWQGMLDKITSAVEENLPRLTELQRERMAGKDVLAPLQDLLKGYLDRWQPHNLFHWVYDIPEGTPVTTLYVPRVQPFEVKPRVELDEYLGLFLTYLQKRSQGKRQQRPG